MGKRRGKQQNISVTGLFKLAGRHKKMDDVFVHHECKSTRWIHSAKNKNKQTQPQTFVTCLLLCLFHFLCALPYVLSSCLFVFSCAFPIRFV